MGNQIILSALIKMGLPLPRKRSIGSICITDKITSNISISSLFGVDPKRLMYQDYELNKVHLLNVSDQPYSKNQAQDYKQFGINLSEISLEDELDIEGEDEEDDIVVMEKLEMGYRHIRKLVREGKHVIVHCRAGVNRSAVVVVYYFMRRIYKHRDALLVEEWLSVIVSSVSTGRSCISIAFGYMILLRELERLLRIRCKKRFSKDW